MSKKKLLSIQEDLIARLEKAIMNYIEAYVTCNTSHESYINQAQQESDWITLKELIETHFPEVDIISIQEKAREQIVEVLNQEEAFGYDNKEEKIQEASSHPFFTE